MEWKCVRPLQEENLLDTVEKTCAIEYPPFYRETVRLYNAGIPVRRKLEIAGVGAFSFGRLISANPGDNPNIFQTAGWMEECEPQVDLIPFAMDNYGGLFCFRYIGGEPCGILLWDQDSGENYYVAETLEELLDMLR